MDKVQAAASRPTVLIFTEDPALAGHLPEHLRASVTATVTADVVRLRPGPEPFGEQETPVRGDLGMLILSGLLARHATFGEITSVELLGPRDVFRPDLVRQRHNDATSVRWEVLSPTRLAVLDAEFTRRVRLWPEIAAALLERVSQRVDFQLLLAATRQARRVEDRVHLALWHFAGRWGEVMPAGRTMASSNITGETLAQIVGARRQSVSTALGALADSGALVRNPDGGVTLVDAPAQLSGPSLRSA